MRRSFYIAWVAVVACLPCQAQIFGRNADDSTRVKKVKRQRDVLASDTLPSVFDSWNAAAKDTTVKRKRNRVKDQSRDEDSTTVGTSNNYDVFGSRSDTVETRKAEKKSRRKKSFVSDTLRIDSPLYEFTVDTVPTKPKRRRQEPQVVEVEYINWDSINQARQMPLTRDQVAALLLDSGNNHLNKYNHTGAIYYFDSLINHYPGTFQHRVAFYFRGKAKMALNRDASAMADFDAFNAMDKCQSSFCTDAHYNLAVLKFRNDRMDDCLKELDWVFNDSTYKNYKYAYFYRGFSHAANQRYIQAIQDLTRFLELDGGRTFSSAEALYYRGFYKAQMTDKRGAIRDYDEAIALYEAGMSKNSTAYQQKLIDTYIVRALAKDEIKKYDEAISDYDVVLKLNPKYATAYRLKGLSQIGKGDTDNGCLSLSRAGELGSVEAYDDIKQHCR